MFEKEIENEIPCNNTKCEDCYGNCSSEDTSTCDYYIPLEVILENPKDNNTKNHWETLMSCQRVRVIGTGSLGKPHQHIGIELWSEFENIDDRVDRKIFETFVEHIDNPVKDGVDGNKIRKEILKTKKPEDKDYNNTKFCEKEPSFADMSKEDQKKIMMFVMCTVNKVTSNHRHGMTMVDKNLVKLCNDQLDIEKIFEKYNIELGGK